MIDILLATYNGAKYIDLQIFSLINQSYTDWKLYIHDDGSTDNTVEIIKKWVSKDSRIIFIDDEDKHLGPGNNFLHLLKYSTSEYICFCDQDDFWFENKLDEYVQKMDSKDNSKPNCCIFSAYLWNKTAITPFLNEMPKNLESLLFTGGTQGCSMVFNKELVKKTSIISNQSIFLHDYLVAFIAMVFGEYMSSSSRLMLYRQHSENVTAHMPKNKVEKILNALIRNRKKSFIYPKMYTDLKTIYATYKNQLTESQRKTLETYFLLPNLNKVKRFIKILFSSFTIGQHSHIYFVIKFLSRRTYLES